MQLVDIKSLQNIYRDDHDDKTVMLNTQAVVLTLIIHRHMILDNNITEAISVCNFCCACTLLKDGGLIDEYTKHVLYYVKDITLYLIRNQNNLVACQCNNA